MNINCIALYILCIPLLYRFIEAVPRSDLQRYKPVPQNRAIHQIITTNISGELLIRDLSCFRCEKCVEGQYDKCSNKHVSSRKHTFTREAVQTAEETDDERNETVMDNMIDKGSILAVYTDDPGEDYYLLNASRKPEILKRDTKDMWGTMHECGSEVVKGFYFEKINTRTNLTITYRYKLVKNVVAYVPLMSVKQILMNDMQDGIIDLAESDHMDILAAVDVLKE